jgi:hypothetical protein
MPDLPDVFINFRSADEGSTATTIERDLSARFGSDKIFRDSKSIQGGDEFPQVLLSAVQHCRVMIAVIGPKWLTARGPDGSNALDNELDWTRRELVEARQRGVRVIPVLIGQGMDRLDRGDLPPELAWLADAQYRRFNNREADADLAALAAELEELVPGLVDRTKTVRANTNATHVTNINGNSGQVHTGRGHQFNGLTHFVEGRGETP